MTQALVAGRQFANDPFCLVDVGASGGIEPQWRLFEPDLVAFGFDPLVRECERLNSLEESSRVRYVGCYIGSEEYDRLLPPDVCDDPVTGWSEHTYQRSSAVRAQALLGMSFLERFNNEDKKIVLADRRTSLDAFFADEPTQSIDFVKVDTDGHDYEVVVGATEVLSKRQVLGLFVECQFQGLVHPHANVFSNIDRVLRELGYSLFDLEVYRYTRACLPGQFVYRIPAQTRTGQVEWGDALYLRDVAAAGYSARWGVDLGREKLLKLACLFEIYGMPDCAAELLLSRRRQLEDSVDVAGCLDMLAREADPARSTFAEYDRAFEEDPERFYPS